ncbi:MAG: phosphotransferase [Alphaproteobacteria bacterium]|nr:phosphotransferase [Alphaproteobacteria bacterium]
MNFYVFFKVLLIVVIISEANGASLLCTRTLGRVAAIDVVSNLNRLEVVTANIVKRAIHRKTFTKKKALLETIDSKVRLKGLCVLSHIARSNPIGIRYMSTSKEFHRFSHQDSEFQTKVIDIFRRINQWQNLDLTTIQIERLGGLANKNYKVSINGECYLLKMPHDAVLHPEIDRTAESYNLMKLGRFGFVPDVLLADTFGIQVRRFIQGRPLKAYKNNLPAMAATLRKLHGGGPFLSNQTDLQRILFTYTRVIEKKGVKLEKEYVDILTHVEGALSRIKQLNLPMTACHNDVHSGNFLMTEERALLLDWEFSGNYYPHYDIGYLFLADNFDISDRKTFLESYFQDALQPRDLDLVDIFHYVARFLIATRMKFLMYEPTEIPTTEFERLFFENLAKLKDPQSLNHFSRLIDRV